MLLAIFALTLGPRLRAVANLHLVALLLVALGVYTWRDLLPFATFELQPADAAGGWLTWSRIGVLVFASVAVPLCIPRPYVALDPNVRPSQLDLIILRLKLISCTEPRHTQPRTNYPAHFTHILQLPGANYMDCLPLSQARVRSAPATG